MKSNHDRTNGTTEKDFAYISDDFDEAGLSPVDFRVFSHIKRRTGRRGVFFEKASSAARICGIKRDTWFASLKRLEGRNMIHIKRRHKDTSEITARPASEWKPAPIKTARGVASRPSTPLSPKVTARDLGLTQAATTTTAVVGLNPNGRKFKFTIENSQTEIERAARAEQDRAEQREKIQQEVALEEADKERAKVNRQLRAAGMIQEKAA